MQARANKGPSLSRESQVRMESEHMIKVSVFYPNSTGATFDMPYYVTRHIPMVRQKLGAALKGASVEQGLGGGQPGSPPMYLALGHLLFDSVEAFQQAWGPHAEAIVSDVPNYTNTQPTIQLSEVKL
jgi:uncharacterized protein (TIGR02118 family)